VNRVQRSVDSPSGIWSNRKEAAAWLGVTTDEFRRACKEFPQLLPATRWGRADKWHWMDLVVFAYLRQVGRIIPAENSPPGG